jgi:hypothetical protein
MDTNPLIMFLLICWGTLIKLDNSRTDRGLFRWLNPPAK